MFQKEILEELKAIRASLLSESAAVEPAKVEEGGDEKDKRITQLENENRRLSYRISHLANNLREALYKQ